MHGVLHQIGTSPRWPELRLPDDNEPGARAAVFQKTGEEIFVAEQVAAFDGVNSAAAAREEVAEQKRRLATCASDLKRVDRWRRWTRPTIVMTSSKHETQRPWPQIAEMAIFFLVSICALGVGVSVQATYVVKSGHELFAVDPFGAYLFAVVTVLAAVGMKVFERQLSTDFAKHCYRSIFYAVGLISFLLWAVTAAITFAPDTTGGRAWIAAVDNGNTATIILVLMHLLGDVAWGYLIFAAAEDLALGNRKQVEMPNLRYVSLTEARDAILAEMNEYRQAIAAAEDYLAKLVAKREETRERAKITFMRACQLWEQSEAYSIATGRASFLRACSLIFATALSIALVRPVDAKSRIVVLPPDYAGAREELMQHLADEVTALAPGDQMILFAARPFRQLALIAIPDSPNAQNRAWVKRRLGEQFGPVLRYIATLPGGTSGDPPGNLMIPTVLDEIGRNVIPGLPGKSADVLLIGSHIYHDRRDSRWSMTDRFFPSDGLLRVPRTEAPFGIAGAERRLEGATLHFCWPGGQDEFATAEHEERMRRWWSMWTTGQSGRVGTFSYELATCFRRFHTGETSGQTAYKASPDAKPEMLRVRAPVPAALPASFATPGEWFMRDDVPISRTPPTTSTGIAWIGLKWSAPCDIDLYARPEGASQWLFFGRVRTPDGFFSKDWLSATGEKQFEYVEFIRPIDLGRAEVAINFYSGNLPAGPEGVIRVWFGGQVYEAAFKFAARSGNGGRLPISGPHWLRIDLREVVGLSPS